MNNEELTRQDLIDSYVLGRMTAREQRDFESRMDGDATIAEDVAFLQTTTAAMADIAAKRRMMDSWGVHNVGAHPCGRPRPCTYQRATTRVRPYNGRPLILITAIAACLLIGFFFVHNIRTEQSAVEESSVISTPALRGNLPACEATELIESGKYEEALSLAQSQINELQAERETIANDATLSTEEREYTISLIDSQLNDLQQIRSTALQALGRSK